MHAHRLREGQQPSRRGRHALPPSDTLLFHLHGGGFVSNSSQSHEVYLRHWATHLMCPILSVDYALSPEHAYPRCVKQVEGEGEGGRGKGEGGVVVLVWWWWLVCVCGVCVCVCVCQGHLQTHGHRQTQTQTHTHTQKQTDRHKHTHRYTLVRVFLLR